MTWGLPSTRLAEARTSSAGDRHRLGAPSQDLAEVELALLDEVNGDGSAELDEDGVIEIRFHPGDKAIQKAKR